jgi:putative methylase
LGRVMQKRLVRKLELEMFLSQIESHPSPRPDLEQYTIPSGVAATMLYIAAYSNNDIVDKKVVDLGCGTGRLALGAAFLGAKQVVGVDIDRNAVKLAVEKSVKMDLKEKVLWVAGDIDAIRGDFDTVLQNPPFGVQKRKADRKFLEKALEMANVVYSLHKHPKPDETFVAGLKPYKAEIIQVVPSPFLKRFIERRGGKIRAVYAMIITVPHMFTFHEKRKHEFVVDLFVIDKK